MASSSYPDYVCDGRATLAVKTSSPPKHDPISPHAPVLPGVGCYGHTAAPCPALSCRVSLIILFSATLSFPPRPGERPGGGFCYRLLCPRHHFRRRCLRLCKVLPSLPLSTKTRRRVPTPQLTPIHIGALRPRAQPNARVGWASALSKDVVPALSRLACLQRAKITLVSISARRRHLSLPNFVFELAV